MSIESKILSKATEGFNFDDPLFENYISTVEEYLAAVEEWLVYLDDDEIQMMVIHDMANNAAEAREQLKHLRALQKESEAVDVKSLKNLARKLWLQTGGFKKVSKKCLLNQPVED